LLVLASEIEIKSNIAGHDVWADDEVIGEYYSKAEANQALDMIHEHINNLAYVQYADGNVDFVPPVFQMPEAGFTQPNKEPIANLEKDLDLYKEALTIVLASNKYVNCDNCPNLEGCLRREVTACISDLREYFLDEARESIAKAERGR